MVALGGAAGGAIAAWGASRPRASTVARYLGQHPDFLADRPELIEPARLVRETRQLAGLAAERRSQLAAKWASLAHPSSSPCLGPLNGTPGFVEFTDYFCAPCRASADSVEQALRAATSRNVILMFVPISGALSEFTAAFMSACYFLNPVAFARLHQKLMTGGAPTQAEIEEQATSHGFQLSLVQSKMESQRISSYIARARQFSQEMGISGVPAFLGFDGMLIQGGISAKQARKMLLSQAGD